MEMMRKRSVTNGFTLLEILIVIAVIGILAVTFLSNFNTSIMRARDSRRKADLNSLQKALGLYYEDMGTFPGVLPSAGTCWSSGANCTGTVYMAKVPGDPLSSSPYQYCAAGNKYVIYATLENKSDAQIITPSNSAICTSTVSCQSKSTCFGVSSSNISP